MAKQFRRNGGTVHESATKRAKREQREMQMQLDDARKRAEFANEMIAMGDEVNRGRIADLEVKITENTNRSRQNLKRSSLNASDIAAAADAMRREAALKRGKVDSFKNALDAGGEQDEFTQAVDELAVENPRQPTGGGYKGPHSV